MSATEKPAYSPISAEQSDSLSVGRIEIGEEVIAAIAAQAATKVEGVYVVGSSFRLTEMFGGKDHPHRGVQVRVNEETGHVEVDVEVNIGYGTVVYEAANQLQMIIKDEVEALTGSLNVDKVNVRVRNIVMPQEAPEEGETISPDKAWEEGE